MSVTLSNDTGSSSSDRVTSDATLGGSGDANAVVTLTEGGTLLGTTTVDGTGHWSFTPVGLADGAHAVAVTLTDLAGNTSATTSSFTLDATVPAATVALWRDTGWSTDGLTSDATLGGWGEANAVVTLTEGAALLGTTTVDGTGRWSFTPVGLADGAHAVAVAVTDLAGNTGRATAGFTLDTSAAVLVRLSNDTGASSSDRVTSDATLRGQAEANAIVTLTEGGTILGRTMADGEGQWSFLPNGLADGVHAVTVEASDPASNMSSTTFAFMLTTTGPALTIALSNDTGWSSGDRMSSDATLGGSAEAHAVVTLTEGGTTLGATTADDEGHWSFSPSGLADGAHVVVATARDLAGNTASATLGFTLDRSAVLTIALSSDTGSSSSDRVSSDATLGGSGDANAVVTLMAGGTILGDDDGGRHGPVVVRCERSGGRGTYDCRPPGGQRGQ